MSQISNQKLYKISKVQRIAYNIMLFAMLHNTFVAPAQGIFYAYFNKPEGLHYLGSRLPVVNYGPNSKEAERTESVLYENSLAAGKTVGKISTAISSNNEEIISDAGKDNSMIRSDLKEGIIGISKENPIDRPSDNLFKLNIEKLPNPNDKVLLEYELYGVQDHNAVSRSINDRAAVGGYIVKKQAGWTKQTEVISAEWLKAGENKVLFTTPQGANYEYKVKNLSIHIQKKAAGNLSSKLVVSNTTITTVKDGKVYIKGFITGSTQGKVMVDAEGAPLTVKAGEFEGVITLNEAIKNRKFLMVKAMDESGLLGQELIDLGQLTEADRIYKIEAGQKSVGSNFKAFTNQNLSIEGASIFVNDGALSEDKMISIQPLRNVDVAPMESGIINVTKGGKAYRFLPDGTKFDKPVKINIEYDTLLMPRGTDPREIRTYFFDTKVKRWTAVKTDTIDRKNRVITAYTTHFTDYINGIIQAPESPGAAGFTSTMMSDIKTADPSAEMTIIRPPSALQTGEAGINYPIKIPSGRHGMQPNLALQYSNDAGNGWLGLGWNLNVPSIGLDTRWGVPVFDSVNESEIYTMGGEQLMYPQLNNQDWMPHRHQDNNQVNNRQRILGSTDFTPRKQGSFTKIERKGTNPTNYYWKVTDTNGTVSWYGGKTGVDDNCVIKDSGNNIVHWGLYMIEDVYGNNIKYHYYNPPLPISGLGAPNENLNGGRIFNVDRINYTGKDDAAGKYEVEFVSNNDFNRQDISVNLKLGVKLIEPFLLKEIKVKYDSNLIRSYELDYRPGKFNKTLLNFVSEKNAGGDEFYRHTFDYYDDIVNDVYFSSEENQSICQGNLSCVDNNQNSICDSQESSGSAATGAAKVYQDYFSNLQSKYSFSSLNPDYVSPDCIQNSDFLVKGPLAIRTYSSDGRETLTGTTPISSGATFLGSTSTKSWSANFYLGVGIGNKFFTKLTTFGGQFTYGGSAVEGLLSLQDIDGDGLLDIVTKVGNTLYYKKHTINTTVDQNGLSNMTHSFQDPVLISGVDNYLRTYSNAKSLNFQITAGYGKFGGFFGRDNATFKSETDIYFTDANSDGLVDIVRDGIVYFNRLVGNVPNFTPNSSHLTPNMILKSKSKEVTVPIEPEENPVIFPNFDVVKVWEAELFARGIEIPIDIELVGGSDYGVVTVTIEKESKFNNLETTLLYKNTLDSSKIKIENANVVLDVEQGERIYFRVHFDSSKPNQPKVIWNPTIHFAMGSTYDVNNLNNYDNKYSDSFILTSPSGEIFPFIKGIATISWPDFQLNNPSDTVKYQIIKKRLNTNQEENASPTIFSEHLIYENICLPNSQNTISSSIIQPIIVDDTQSELNTFFYFRVISTSNINWKNGLWKPKIVYTSTMDNTDFNTSQTIYPIADYSLYKSKNRSSGNLEISSTSNCQINLNHAAFTSGIFSSTDNGTINFIVKRLGAYFVGKRLLTVSNGNVTFDDYSPINLYNAEYSYPSSEVEVSITSDNGALLEKVIASYSTLAVVTGDQNISIDNNAILFCEKTYSPFGPLYRQWGQFFYNQDAVIGAAPINGLVGVNLIKPESLTFSEAQAQTVKDACDYINTIKQLSITEEEMDTLATNYNNLSKIAILPASPLRVEDNGTLLDKWIGQHSENYCEEFSVRSTTLDASLPDFKSVSNNQPITISDTGAYAISKFSDGNAINYSLGAKFSGDYTNYTGTGTVSYSKSFKDLSNSLTDYADFNGDGYPDIISTTQIQFTNKTGGLTSGVPLALGHLGETSGKNWGLAASGSFGVMNGESSKKTLLKKFIGKAAGGISGNISKADSSVKRTWVDINGDGLSDLLELNSSDLNISLNNGKIFNNKIIDNAVIGNSLTLYNSHSDTSSGGIGVNLWKGSFEAGVSLFQNKSNSLNTLVDINNDGLVDLISADNGFNVKLNNGNKFVDSGKWSDFDLKEETESVGTSVNTSVTFSVPFTFPFFGLTFKLPAVSIGGTPYATTTNKILKSVTDFNGDGYPDLLTAVEGTGIKVYYSKIGRTNMLKTVNNPIGGSFTVDYQCNPVSYNNPHAKWVMKSVQVSTGTSNDPSATVYSKKFRYLNARYDRRERQFYGFEKVMTETVKNLEDNSPLRSEVATYYNQSYFLKGILKESYIVKGMANSTGTDSSNLFSKNINTYKVYGLSSATGKINTGTDLPDDFDTGGTNGRHTAAVLLTKTENLTYELGNNPMSLITEFVYDGYGNVTSYKYNGGSQTAMGYTSSIAYHDDNSTPGLSAKNLLRIPKCIKVSVLNNPEIRKRTTTLYPDSGDIQSVNVWNSSTETLTTSMEYDEYGNTTKITTPTTFYIYEMDPYEHKYVIKTQEPFDTDTNLFESTALYDYKFDKIKETVDIGGNHMKYGYDSFGRLETVQAPKEIATSASYTIKFQYFPKLSDVFSSDLPNKSCVEEGNFKAFALTGHYDVQHPNDDIETITIMDGLGRVVQMKKDIQYNANAQNTAKMSISGRVRYDEYGRAIEQYHPRMEDKAICGNYLFSPIVSGYLSTTDYDALDRPIKVIDPIGAISETFYTLTDNLQKTTIQTKITEDKVALSESYTDVSGRVVKTNTRGNEDIFTLFNYNSIGELQSYTDASNLQTSFSYDNLGRKTSVTGPNSGQTKYKYNNLGQLSAIQTANLKELNIEINYEYLRNRLINIIYPEYYGSLNLSNVHYEYGDQNGASSGNPNQDIKNRGRLVFQSDATGTQKFSYGLMGEMVLNIRRVQTPNGSMPLREFTTTYTYDSWNRLLGLGYPDGSGIGYSYDLGGNLLAMPGFISRIDYDEFEQKTYMEFSNSDRKTYTYDPASRRLNNLNIVNGPNVSYQYDKIGNVTMIESENIFNGGRNYYKHNYSYDNLNRLVNADGTFFDNTMYFTEGLNQSDYTLDLGYTKTNQIAFKTQNHTKYYNSIQVPENSYDETYQYKPGTHQLLGPNYDKNGNMEGKYGLAMMWNDSNKLCITLNTLEGNVQHYLYDAAGERVMKASTSSGVWYTGGQLFDSNVSFDSYTTYPSPFLTVDQYGQYTNHYYVGTERIASMQSSNSDPFVVSSYAKSSLSSKSVNSQQDFNFEELRQKQVKDLQNYLDKYGNVQVQFKEYQSYQTLESENQEKEEGSTTEKKTSYSYGFGTYFYHNDHLGSGTYLTDVYGSPYQYFVNLPYGETMAEGRSYSGDYDNPYKFNGKELDSETGLYYYGARYYDPKLSIWMSVDPLAEKYPAASPYNYCFNNPVIYTDPNGLEPTPYEAALMASHIYDRKVDLVGGWCESARYFFDKNKPNGFRGAMYERTKENGEIEYAYVYAGTDDMGDVANDLAQVAGLSSQYAEAADLSRDISNYCAGDELTFVGHSLGGGLANLSSLKTGRSSITFNPAWLSNLTIGQTRKLGKGRHRRNFIHTSDPLNLLQQAKGWKYGLESTGENNYVSGGWNLFKNNIFTGHLINTMINRMQKNGQALQHGGKGNDGIIPANPRDH